MTDVANVDAPRALLEDPRIADAAFLARTLKREVKDARPIETGDLLFETVKRYKDNQPSSIGLTISLATFKPEENPARLTLDGFQYPESRTMFINKLQLLEVRSDGDTLEDNRECNTQIADGAYQFQLDDKKKQNPPKKEVYEEDYDTSTGPMRRRILLEKPALKSSSSMKILNPDQDLSGLHLNRTEMLQLLENARQARAFLAKNLLDQPEETINSSDPRLHQLDGLINYLAVQTGFTKP